MELEQPSGSSPGNLGQRKERGAIAAQACDTCRSRKQKCDEQRPQCALCRRMNLECRYREPQPTKKDKTLVEILDRLTSLEGKVDRLSTATRSPAPPGFGPPQPSPSSQPSFNTEVDDNSPFLVSQQLSQQAEQEELGGDNKGQTIRHVCGSFKMLAWPAIQHLLLRSLSSDLGDLRSLEQEGSTFLLRLEERTPNLPMDDTLQTRPFIGMQSQATRNMGATRVTFPGISRELMYRLAVTYFDTFNILYPLLDRETFISDTLTRVDSEGFDADTDSVIALLVLALGELAIGGSYGDPIEVYKGRPSGIRGGTLSKPPGLAFFNEARTRIGFIMTECELETVQIFSLAALYYECTFRHADFWRMTISASHACHTLITCKTIDWNSQRGDLIKRAYWHCATMEMALNLELDVAPTGLAALESQVGMPRFNTPFYVTEHGENHSAHFQAHYASQVALWRLRSDIRTEVDNTLSSTATTPPTSTTESFTGSTIASIKQLAAKLAHWRSLLPPELQWLDENCDSFPTLQAVTPDSFNNILDPNLSPGLQNAGFALFTADLDSEPAHYPYIYDVQVALLRTRYYYTKYMVYQPLLYKALHFPERLTEDDARGVAEFLQSCLKWPIALSPTSRRKRLIPYLFGWSQTFLSILLILQLTQHNPVLRDIRAQFCGPVFEADIGMSIEVMIDWIRDLKSSDSIAKWCWNILQGLYQVDEQGEVKGGKGFA